MQRSGFEGFDIAMVRASKVEKREEVQPQGEDGTD